MQTETIWTSGYRRCGLITDATGVHHSAAVADTEAIHSNTLRAAVTSPRTPRGAAQITSLVVDEVAARRTYRDPGRIVNRLYLCDPWVGCQSQVGEVLSLRHPVSSPLSTTCEISLMLGAGAATIPIVLSDASAFSVRMISTSESSSLGTLRPRNIRLVASPVGHTRIRISPEVTTVSSTRQEEDSYLITVSSYFPWIKLRNTNARVHQ